MQPGEPMCDHGSVILDIGEAMALVNRIQRACDVPLSVTEQPPDADRELARILAEAELPAQGESA